jgi:hypothetical protein
MSKIVISDLETSEKLDAQAMRDITGGMSTLSLQNAPNSARFASAKTFLESKLVRGLVLTPGLREAAK